MLKGKVPIIVALVLGLLAYVVSTSALKKKQLEVTKGWDLVKVVVAGVDISEGTVVTNDMIQERDIPSQFVTSSVVGIDSAGMVVGQKVLVQLQKGDPLLWSHFSNTKGERLSTKVQKKARAVTIDTKGVQAVGGWVRPNDHVDIIGTFKEPNSGEQMAVTLLQNVIVLATGKITGTTNVNAVPEGQREYANVSLLVMPEEAEILVLAQELGALTLSLRNDEDVADGLTERGRTTINSLLSGERIKAVQKLRRETLVIIKGSSTETQTAGPPGG